MATKDSKNERVKQHRGKDLLTGNPTALVEAIAAIPIATPGKCCVGATVAVLDIHDMELMVS